MLLKAIIFTIISIVFTVGSGLYSTQKILKAANATKISTSLDSQNKKRLLDNACQKSFWFTVLCYFISLCCFEIHNKISSSPAWSGLFVFLGVCFSFVLMIITSIYFKRFCQKYDIPYSGKLPVSYLSLFWGLTATCAIHNIIFLFQNLIWGVY